MNKNELVDTVAERSGLKKNEAEKTVDAVFDTITSALRGGDEVRIVGFGTFSVSARGERRPQPAHRREDDDRALEAAQVSRRQGVEGRDPLIGSRVGRLAQR